MSKLTVITGNRLIYRFYTYLSAACACTKACSHSVPFPQLTVCGVLPRSQAASWVIAEITNGGLGGYHDRSIEVANWSAELVDTTGWGCTRTGSVASAQKHAAWHDRRGGALGFRPGERSVHNRGRGSEAAPSTSLANGSYDVLLRDTSREGAVLASIMDSAAGENFPRTLSTR